MFAVCRIKKFKDSDVRQVLMEAQRTPELHYKKGVEFDNDIDWTKTSQNKHIISCEKRDISRKMKNEGVKLRNKDSVALVGAIVTASPEYFSKDKDDNWLYDDKAQSFGADVKEFVVATLCGGDASRLVSLQLHMDEKSPHWHALVLPIVDGPDGERKLSAKALLNGRQRMREIQNQAFERLGKPRGFERGELVDLDQPSKSQKRHKTTGQHRDEQFQEALDRVIKSAEHMEREDANILKDLKDASFGRGKILPYDKYDQVVEIINRLDAIGAAIKALRDLRSQVDRSGRIKTLEGTINNAHKVVDRVKPELLFRRQYDALADKIFESMKVSQDKTALDILHSCVERATYNGDLNIEKALSAFKQEVKATKANEQAFQQDLDGFEFPSMEDPDGLDDPIFGGI
mgnify:CR=1 FL=1|jgi:hypothetical protein